MKICCFGSLNIDYVYQVRQFVRAGETIHSVDRSVICGGKGLNQSIAMARSGAEVYHAGNVGASDGGILIDALRDSGADVSLVNRCDTASGHAIIQVDENGENCILLYGGANRMVSTEQIESVLANFAAGDFLVLQNEINALAQIIDVAHGRGMQIVLNPSPVEGILDNIPLEKIDYLFVNEKEVCQIGGASTPAESIAAMRSRYPEMTVVCTLGARGAEIHGKETLTTSAIPAREVIDTTGAGDTFLGYFIGSLSRGCDLNACMRYATAAATLCVEKKGASASIPSRSDVEKRLKEECGS